jgi:imidazole glycerol-phosphate synthase subunit HisF
MLKRLVGVITVKNNWAVQSIGYKKYLPIGRPEIIAENYDRWQLDEILIIDIDRSKLNLGPNYELLEKITSKRLMTPLCYMGGIRSSHDALKLINRGADRIALDSLFRHNPDIVDTIADTIGLQAVIKVQPLIVKEKEIFCYDYLKQTPFEKLDPMKFVKRNKNFSELMIVDVENEGVLGAFNENLISMFSKSNLQLICFGGISNSSQVKRILSNPIVSAIAIGNSLSYREIPHKSILPQTEVDLARQTSFGKITRGAKDW